MALLLAGAALLLHLAAGWLAPMARHRLVRALQERLGSPVQVGRLTTGYDGSLIVEATDLSAQSVLLGVPGDPTHPMLHVRHLWLRMPVLPALLGRVQVRDGVLQGVEVVLPPAAVNPAAAPLTDGNLHLSQLTLEDAHLTFLTGDSRRAPLRFDLPHTLLTGLDDGPIRFAGTVDTGSPVGVVNTTGTLGAWQAADPRTTALTGSVAFRDRNMAGVRGLRGSLSLQANFGGTLGRVEAEGTTDDPAFALDVSARPEPLHTRFSMVIDAIGGVVQMRSIDAHLPHTHLLLAGSVTKSPAPQGYAMDLLLQVPEGRVEDALLLGAPTQPTLLAGALTMRGRLQMAAGPEAIVQKLSLHDGSFHLSEARFGNAAVQRSVDSMSTRAEGEPQKANPTDAAPTTAAASGKVTLQAATLHFSAVRLTAPGVQIALGGTYPLGGGAFRMTGSMHTDAKASQLNTGLKSWLTRPFNGLFAHGRTGATFPLLITGSGNTPRFKVLLPGGKAVTADH